MTDDLHFGTKERVLPQRIFMRNMKALSLTIQKLWPIMLKVFRTNKQTNGQPKNNVPQSIDAGA